MKRFIVKRLIYAAFLVWAIATLLFVGLRAVPGGPVRTMLGTGATEAQVEAMREELGLNRPPHEQYTDWMTDLLMLDFGNSYRTGEPVIDVLFQAFPKTLSIGFFGVAIALAIAIPTGIVSATKRNQIPDYVATIIAFFGLSAPAFFIGLLLIVIFGVWIDLIPVFGYNSLREDGFVPWITSIFLPAIAVGLPYAAVVMRMMRSSLLEELGKPYMKTARSKGVASRVRLYKHAFQNALIPVVTVAGIQLAVVIGGSVTVEIVFGIQGIGQVIVNSVMNRDYPVTQGVIMIIATGFILINLLVDIAYTAIDPRIRYGDAAT